MDWKIIKTESDSETGIVEMATYKCSKSEEEHYAEVIGDIYLLENPDSPTVPESPVPYSDLTEEVVLEWVKDKIGESNVKNIEDRVQEIIGLKKSPAIVEGLPWA